HEVGLRSLGALADLVGHLLLLGEAAEAGGVDRRVVHEHVLSTFIGCDEAEAFLRTEPFHGSLVHATSPSGVGFFLRALTPCERPGRGNSNGGSLQWKLKTAARSHQILRACA